MRIERIGNATLYLGDCQQIVNTLDGIDVVVTDPPYVLSVGGKGMGKELKYLASIKAANIHKGFDMKVLDRFECFAVFCSKAQIVDLIRYTKARKLNWQLLTWNKPNPTPLMGASYLPDTEYVVHGWKKGHLFGSYEDRARFILWPVERSPYNHPTVKPQGVMRKILKTASDKGHNVLDPFMGTGSTGVAALALQRRFVGIEQDPAFFEIACERIRQAVNDLPLLRPLDNPTEQQELF